MVRSLKNAKLPTEHPIAKALLIYGKRFVLFSLTIAVSGLALAAASQKVGRFCVWNDPRRGMFVIIGMGLVRKEKREVSVQTCETRRSVYCLYEWKTA